VVAQKRSLLWACNAGWTRICAGKSRRLFFFEILISAYGTCAVQSSLFVVIQLRLSGICWARRQVSRFCFFISIEIIGAPKRNRTPVFAVKGRHLKFIIVRDGPLSSLIYKKLLFIEFNIARA
jgi:hypothetical protein